jgi:hypothetical protein
MSIFARKRVGCCILALGLSMAGIAAAETQMEREFRSPPVSARPWVYWWWLNSNVTREGITRDLEEMHRQGIQGAMIFNAGEGNTPKGPKFLSPEWNALFKFALAEASRLGMEISVNLCDGWDSGGPWIPAEAANKKLTWSETQVDGPQTVSKTLPMPPMIDNFYRDVAVLAVREKPASPLRPAEIRGCNAVGDYCDEKNWPPADVADGDLNTVWRAAVGPAPNAPAWIDYVYAEPVAASAIYLAGGKDSGPENCALQVSDDGVSFKTLLLWKMAKGKAKRVEFPEVKAKIFRLVVQSSYTPDVQLAEMWVLRKGDQPQIRPGIKWWWFKSGNRGFWYWPKEGPAVMDEEYPEDGAADCKSTEVVNLSTKLGKDGKLTWDVPEGRWTILRFGYTLEGQRTRCSSTVIGYEADMLDPIGIETHFKHCAEPLLNAAGQYAGKTLKYLHVDSYEVGADVQGQQPTWSAIFLDEFRKRRGYDPLPYLPAMARRIVDNREKTDRFLFDMRMTVSDLMCDCFFGRLAQLAHARRVGIHCETGYGTYPHPQFDGLRAAGQCDVTMGEFWWGTDVMTLSEHYCNAIRSVASAAHVYGKKIVQAESFTSWRHFPEYPATLKPIGDLAFCDGLNRIMFHQYTHQPNEDLPGYQYFAGTHIDRHVTWWNMSKPFLTYLARCQNILQSGRFHADVAYFYGEGTSKYVPTKKFLKPALPAGYNFDCVNADVLLNGMTVDKNGKLVLPSGMTYGYMVLPTQRTMSPAVLRKIKQLIEVGAMVIGDQPLRTPGLTNWPDSDKELKDQTGSLWGNRSNVVAGVQGIGKGMLIQQMRSGTAPGCPDFESQNKNQGFEFIHRVIDGGDFYFVSNQTNAIESGDFTFRIKDRAPELWDPVTGDCRSLPEYEQTTDERMRIPLTFEPYQSFFVIFHKPIGEARKPAGQRNFPLLGKVAELTGPWTVAFDPKWGGPEKIVFDKLEDWTKRPEAGIKFYSGTAVYRKTFDLADLPSLAKKPIYLDLGTVNYLARVRLNGRDLGVVWTAPWRVDISGVVKAKHNELEIEVVNTWLNRLVGDAQLPPEKRLGKTNVQYPPNQPLMPSGLLGPVTVQREE